MKTSVSSLCFYFICLTSTCLALNESFWRLDNELNDVWRIRPLSLKEETTGSAGSRNFTFDYSRVPQVGNGYLGHTVFSDSLYVNNVFFGTGSETRLAKIPARIVHRVRPFREEIENEYVEMNMNEGYYHEYIKTKTSEMGVRVFAHQAFPQALVYQSYLSKTVDQPTKVTFEIPIFQKMVAEDFEVMNHTVFEAPSDGITSFVQYYYGRPRAGKDLPPAADAPIVYCYFKPDDLPIFPSEGAEKKFWNNWIVVDTDAANAKYVAQQMSSMSLTSSSEIFTKHTASWRNNFWKVSESAPIQVVTGNSLFEKSISSALFTMASNVFFPALPSATTVLNNYLPKSYVGLGTNTLASGDAKYRGKIAWQSDTWNFLPAMLLFPPDVTKNVLKYRISQRQKAEENGAKFPSILWTSSESEVKNLRFATESAAGGDELVSTSVCPDCSTWQLYQSGLVALSMRHYAIAGSSDRDIANFMRDWKGYEVLKGVSSMFQSAMKNNNNGESFTIPSATLLVDRDGKPGRQVSDDLFTNALASQTIDTARFVNCLIYHNTPQKSENTELVNENAAKKARNIFLPFDKIKRQHKIFSQSTDADVTDSPPTPLLLTYPMGWRQPKDVMANDYALFKKAYDRSDVRIDQLAQLVIAACANNERADAGKFFSRMFEPDVHIKEPFKLFKDYHLSKSFDTNPQADSHVYLTGASAVISSLLFGFIGLHIDYDKIEFRNPHLPIMDPSLKAGFSKITIPRIYYRESTFMVILEPSRFTIRRSGTSRYKIYRSDTDTTVDFSGSETVPITNKTLTITLFNDRSDAAYACASYLNRDYNKVYNYKSDAGRPHALALPVIMVIAAVLPFWRR